MDIQLYEMDKYVKQTIIGEKIPSNSKILSFNLLQGGAEPLITQESLETNDSNKGFLEIISNYFGSDLATRIKTLLPLASMYFLSSEFSSGQNGGGINPEFKNYILPICTMIIGYSYKEKLGEDKFNVLAVVCVCYCIYLLSNTQKPKINFVEITSEKLYVGPKPGDSNSDSNSDSDSNFNSNTNSNQVKQIQQIDKQDLIIPKSRVINSYFLYNKNGIIWYKKIGEEEENNTEVQLNSDVEVLYQDEKDFYYKDNTQKQVFKHNYLSNKSRLHFNLQGIIEYKFYGELYSSKSLNRTFSEYSINSLVSNLNSDISYPIDYSQIVKIGTTYYLLDSIGSVTENIPSSTNKNINNDVQNIFNVGDKLVSYKKNNSITIDNSTKQNIDDPYFILYDQTKYLISQGDKPKKYEIVLSVDEYKIVEVLEVFVGPITNNSILSGGAKTTDEYGLLPMITQGIKWLSENITSLITKANNLMKNFISGTKITFENFSEQIIKFITGSKSIITPELLRLFEFNNSTGHIQFKGPSNYKIVTQITDKIFIYFNGDITTYKVNGEQLDTISTIQSKPFATALVLAYIEHMKSLGLGKTLISPSNEFNKFNKYVYELAPDATVKIYEKETNKLVQSMGLAIQQWDSGDGITAAQTTQNVCKEMFGIDSQTKSNTCSKYFYSILGRSALGMIQILGTEAKSKSSVIQLLKQANPAIKYEILKNLEWKTNSKRNLIKLDEWIKLQSETRPEIAEYLQTESGKLVKEILENYITDVEQWIHSLEEPKELTKPIKSLGPKRLTATQVARLRSSQIEDTAKLIVTDLESKQTYTLKPMSGGECENNKNKTNNLCVQEFESKLATIKAKLEGGNKILSSNTETKIRLLINQVAGLEDFGPVNLYGKKLAQLTNVFGKLESLV